MIGFRILIPVVLNVLITSCCGAQNEIAFAYGTKIWIVDTSNSTVRLVTDLPNHDRPISWSPDGKRILFWKHSEIGWDFWTVLDDGSEPQRLTKTESGGYRSASWSPDGKLIAYMRDDPEGLYLMEADGTRQRQLTNFGYRESVPCWSADGDQLLMYYQGAASPQGKRSGLYVKNLVGSVDRETRFLTSGWAGAWSPANNEVVCLSRTDDHTVITLVDVASGRTKNLAKAAVDIDSLAWSPTGKEIAFLRKSGDREMEVCVVPLLHLCPLPLGESWVRVPSRDGGRWAASKNTVSRTQIADPAKALLLVSCQFPRFRSAITFGTFVYSADQLFH